MQQDFLLVRKMQNGDETAMDLFVRKYYPRILQYCRYHCADRDEAQDLTQDTFERFFRNLAGYRHSGKDLNYLYTIARNLCIDWERKKREITADIGGEAAAEGMSPLTEKVICGGSPETGKTDRSDRIEEQIMIEEALRKLPEELREIVILHYFQELSLKEAARVLQIGLPLAKYRIRRARELLERELR